MILNKKTGLPMFVALMAILGSYALGLKALAEDNFALQRQIGNMQIIEQSILLPISAPPKPNVAGTMAVVVTGYSSTEDQTDDSPFITASNKQVRDGIIANNFLSFGTKIRIPELFGDKVFEVDDRMSWKKGNDHVDVWFPSREEAKHFGAKTATLEVLID